jgi:hypothetical protein
MIAAACQTSNPYHVLLMIALIMMFSTIIDLMTATRSTDPKVRDGRVAFCVMSPLPWAFAMVFRKIKGVAAPVWMPWTVALVIYAAVILMAHILG